MASETGEVPAYSKLLAGLGMAQEAAAELGIRRQDRRWGLVAIGLEKMRALVQDLFVSRQSRSVQGNRVQ